MTQQPKYGAISGSADPDFEQVEGAEDRGPSDYDMGETYYLKKTSGGWKKTLRALIPLLIALGIVGGVGYYFFERVLNPSGSGGGEIETTDETVKETTKSIPISSPTTTEAKGSSKSSGSSSSASCKAHPKCIDTGLKGMCCPTSEDVMLDCCN